MQVYIALVQEEEDVVGSVGAAIQAWLGAGKDGIHYLDTDADGPGVEVTTTSKSVLKDPLHILFTIAKQYQCNFVVGFVDPATNTREDVCYFGHEEGRPDLYEIACYLQI